VTYLQPEDHVGVEEDPARLERLASVGRPVMGVEQKVMNEDGSEVAVAWRHANVMMETSAMRPKHMMREHSGWGPLFNYSSVLADRVMFGTAWPMLRFKRSVDEFRQFPIKDEVKQKWLYANAARLLGFL
jgi:predicted TIM-barrel fold metal-dependent hydrolase